MLASRARSRNFPTDSWKISDGGNMGAPNFSFAPNVPKMGYFQSKIPTLDGTQLPPLLIVFPCHYVIGCHLLRFRITGVHQANMSACLVPTCMRSSAYRRPARDPDATSKQRRRDIRHFPPEFLTFHDFDVDLRPFGLKIGTPVSLAWPTFTPILLFYAFLFFQLGARTNRRTDGRTGKSRNAAY